MGIFDFFKRKKDIEDDIDLEEALNIKEIKEEDNTNINTTNTETDSFNYNFVIDNIEEFHNRNELTPEELKSLITGEILRVVDKSQSFDSMEAYAKEAAKAIGIENIQPLTEYLYGGISKPNALKGRYNGLGAWPNAVKNAVLTILYSFNENSVDELLKIANEKSDGCLFVRLYSCSSPISNCLLLYSPVSPSSTDINSFSVYWYFILKIANSSLIIMSKNLNEE